MKSQPSNLLYDGECGLCSTLVNLVLKRSSPRKIRCIALQSCEGQSILKNFGLSTSELTSVVYIRNDHYYRKSTASLLILKDLGGLWQLIYIFRIIPRPIRDAIYNLIAKNRYRFFGKQKSCTLE